MNDTNTTFDWSSVKQDTPEWFRDAKFGLFFHWGPYSVPAYQNEWYSRNMYAKGLEQNQYHEKTYGSLHDFGYKDFYPMMDGSRFDPDEWADLVVRSGARYGGPVTEHSDNFSMWDSSVNPINCVNYGPHRDIVGECAKAFRKRGLKFLSTFHHQWLWGWFMSTDNEADVYDPANEIYYGPALPLETNRYIPYRYPDKAFCETWKNKVLEVIDKYEPDALYFDSRTCIIDEESRFAVADYFYNKTGHRNSIITYKQEDFPKGIGVFDIECGRFSQPKDYAWQSDDRLEDNITWCMVQEPKYKSAGRIIHQLCDIVSKNGCLLLNVGPYADGSFHPDAVKTLYEIGDWLKINGEAIYETRPFVIAAEGPTTVTDANYDVEKIQEQLDKGDAVDVHSDMLTEQDFRFTTKGSTVYAIAMGWSSDNVCRIRSLGKNKIGKLSLTDNSRITLLGSEAGALRYTQDEECLTVFLPDEKPCDHAYALKIEA
jgi:alpha-L-fucosidase